MEGDDKIIKFDLAAKRKQRQSKTHGVNRDRLVKLLGTIIVFAALGVAYYSVR